MSTILTFHFPTEFDPSKNREWQTGWDRFSRATLKSNGGVVCRGTCGGGAVDRRSFCGVIRYINLPAVKQHLLEEESRGPLYGGLVQMKALASEGMVVEFASMYELRDGWLGSVIKTHKDDPRHNQVVERFARFAKTRANSASSLSKA